MLNKLRRGRGKKGERKNKKEEKRRELLDLIDKGVIQQTIAVQFHVAKSTDGKIYKLEAEY
jgi:DNA invertase Pin-like site-specific DNA recombinase